MNQNEYNYLAKFFRFVPFGAKSEGPDSNQATVQFTRSFHGVLFCVGFMVLAVCEFHGCWPLASCQQYVSSINYHFTQTHCLV